jgi:hypothetical protein
MMTNQDVNTNLSAIDNEIISKLRSLPDDKALLLGNIILECAKLNCISLYPSLRIKKRF